MQVHNVVCIEHTCMHISVVILWSTVPCLLVKIVAELFHQVRLLESSWCCPTFLARSPARRRPEECPVFRVLHGTFWSKWGTKNWFNLAISGSAIRIAKQMDASILNSDSKSELHKPPHCQIAWEFRSISSKIIGPIHFIHPPPLIHLGGVIANVWNPWGSPVPRVAGVYHRLLV